MKHIIIPSEVSKKFLNLPVSIDSSPKEKKMWGYFWKRYPLTFDFCLNLIDFVKENKIHIFETPTLYEIIINPSFIDFYIEKMPYQLRPRAKKILERNIIRENLTFNDFVFENLLAVWIEKVYDSRKDFEYLVVRLHKLIFKPLVEETYFRGGNKYIKIPKFFYPISSHINENYEVLETNSIYKLNVFSLTESIEKEKGNIVEVSENTFWRANIIRNENKYEGIKKLSEKSQQLLSFLQENGIQARIASSIYWNRPEKTIKIFLKET